MNLIILGNVILASKINAIPNRTLNIKHSVIPNAKMADIKNISIDTLFMNFLCRLPVAY